MPEPKTIPLTVAHTKYIVCVEGYPLSDINKNCYFAGIKGLSVKDSVVSRLLKTFQCIGLGLVNFFYMEGYGLMEKRGAALTNINYIII